MYNRKTIISIIPARGGSKGIPRKNLRQLCGRPLITYSIMQSLSSVFIDKTIVSTEDPEIAEVSLMYGADVVRRPSKLATDTASTETVLIHVMEELKKQNIHPDYVVLLQPTSPIRGPKDIDDAIKLLIDQSADSLLSVRENSSFFWSKENIPLNYDYKKRPRRQEKSWEFIENGSIYITKAEGLLKQKNRLNGKIVTYIMPDWASFEIDTEFDFELVEMIARSKLPFTTGELSKIKLAIFDVDGVFTDGSVYVDQTGNEMLRFSRIDGKGIEMLQKNGVVVAVITQENTSAVKARMAKLGVSYLFTGVLNKVQVFDELKTKLSLDSAEIAYCADDLGDLNAYKKAGFKACPVNAVSEIKRESDYVSSNMGGEGFVRDVCNLILKSRGILT